MMPHARSLKGIPFPDESDKPEEKPKKEPTPKERKIDYVLFVRDDTDRYNEIDSYSDPKALSNGIKEKVEALPEGAVIPNWFYSTCRFKEVKAERINAVKVKL